MLPGLMLTMALLSADSPNLVQEAADYYQQVETYQATIKSSYGNLSDKTDVLRYYYKKPGYVRMEVIEPFNGTVLVYSPKTEKVKLWLFGDSSFPSLSLSPENKMIQGPSGQRIDRSDLGVLYQEVMLLQNQGKTTVLGTDSIAGQSALQISVQGAGGFSVGAVSRMDLWLDVTNGFPLKVMSYGTDGSLIEMVEILDYQINPTFPVGLFDQ
ncbi:LolA family protein [Nitrosomonas communis]|uniref:Outer membrane lipoprotein-sorting protein n=1 Tax=Nitrosomonas communis TaxID=44574 RepID=A0A1I4PLT7_9PROT|nr:hypothetical protein [Nitrosomonas communis]SFM28687.1 Outer membrane lipoprotein-sorting protein [Nitrosomonas communis]